MLCIFNTPNGKLAVPVTDIKMIYEQSNIEEVIENRITAIVEEEPKVLVSVNEGEGYEVNHSFDETCMIYRSAYLHTYKE